MKLTYFSSSTVPSRTANSVHVVKMAEALARTGAKVTLLARIRRADEIKSAGDSFEFYGVDRVFSIKRIPWQRRSMVSAVTYALRGLAQILQDRPDLVVSRNVLGSWLASFAGFAVIHEAHSPEHLEGKAKNFLLRTMIRRKTFKGLIVISTPLKELFLESGLARGKPITVLPDGASVSGAGGGEHLARAEPGPFVVGYAGSLYTGRGIELIGLVARSCPWAEFVVAGGEKTVVDQLRSAHEDVENLTFLGYLAPSAVPQFLRGCSALLAPYQVDTSDAVGRNTARWMSPLKIFEYMAAGRPIVSSDLPVLKEVLRHGENSLLVASGDVEAWAMALRKICDEPNWGEALAAVAYSEVEKDYSWETRARRVIEIYSSAADPKSSGPSRYRLLS